jgi:hypothetical protein
MTVTYDCKIFIVLATGPIFVSKTEAYPIRLHFKSWLLAMTANIRLWSKCVFPTNALAYYRLNKGLKSFIP